LKETAMLKKTCVGAVLLAAAAVSTTAMADDRGVNTAVGALVGAAIGGSAGGRDGAIVGGVLGAAVGSSVRTNDDYYRGRGYVSGGYSTGYSSGYYQPAPVYVESRPVYTAPPRYYYDARPEVVYVNRDRGYRDRGYDRDHDHDRGYERGYERGYDRGHDRGGWHR
jgi:hypothetical protein